MTDCMNAPPNACRELPPSKPSAAGAYAGTKTPFDFDASYTGNVGNDMGISTVGYRSAKVNTPEWHETNYSKYYQAYADRDNAENVRNLSKDMIRETQSLTDQNQLECSKRLAERLKDIHFWRSELAREIRDLLSETDSMLAQKKRLENGLRCTEIPLHIASDNLNCRQRREGNDLVQDDVELHLLKEVEVINNVQDLLKKTIREVDAQISRNRDRKEELEHDWSDKKQADEIDTFCVGLRNENTHKQFYGAAAKFQEVQSTPESWAQHSHDLIARAEHERMASLQLRTLVDNVFVDTSRDMREQADSVDVALKRRADEIDDAYQKLAENLQKVCIEISSTEGNIRDLKQAIKDKEDPMKVSQTRLHQRFSRPNVELCRDPAQFHLVAEVNEIARSTDLLIQKLGETENALKDLQDNRMALEKEMAVKKNSSFIDRTKCMRHRQRYPATTQLQGYKF